MIIRKSDDSDINQILDLELKAFGSVEGPEIVDLVSGIFIDPSARPLLSLVAISEDQILGHILFTPIRLINQQKPIKAVILAPLAVIPKAQSKGVGGKLINEGLKQLTESGVQLVFVLGHPDYYPRFGFSPAGVLGFEAPYPIPDKNAGAWMVQELDSGIIGKIKGRVRCADVMNKPEYWRE